MSHVAEQKRKRLTPKEREFVYQKYGGHCAYCGCKIEKKDMQVDHSIPRNRKLQKDRRIFCGI